MPPLPIVTPQTLADLIRRGRAIWDEFEDRAIERHHLFVPCDQEGAFEMLRKLRPRAGNFLEFGSGAGVVTILADLLGYDACGIEIEQWLVDQSELLAREFGSVATFAQGSFVPPAYQEEVENLAHDRMTPTAGARAYDELSMDLSDFDLVFAYPWPGEEEWLYELMRRHSRDDALLMTYDLQQGFEVNVVGEL